MVIKQIGITCYCGLPMEFPEGQVKTECLCGAVWELGCEGYWYTQGPIVTTETAKTKSSRYERYMSRRNKRKRKGGRR
ncbi:hypothetical protein DEAC_c40440 [Desulfosporosinus acididurans]|uniref:Uncharacterized protein n=1 Tax=Desulfosporosinus acididurans TaxID=476652 RepID=A0A0J1FKP9_9FIRM|nr:hypothetical protein [Desulfosporosinus acididurans]KLU64050.1 hypothetical protein DEAC_c40440 [Desulfosporosinus acididurans]